MNVNPIPKIQPITVDLANLRPGVRYSFKSNSNPANTFEGTFERFSPPANGAQGQYIFLNYAEYNPQGILVFKAGSRTFGVPNNYPHDIFVVASRRLPGDLNEYINKFGGKSRKSKRRNTKSKRRRNRKSKRRR